MRGLERNPILPLRISLVVQTISNSMVEKMIRICFGRMNASDTAGKNRRGKKNRIVMIIPSAMLSKRGSRDFFSMSSL